MKAKTGSMALMPPSKPFFSLVSRIICPLSLFSITNLVASWITFTDVAKTAGIAFSHRNGAKGERLFRVTDRANLDPVVSLYKLRWSIETAFGFLKSKGFDFG